MQSHHVCKGLQSCVGNVKTFKVSMDDTGLGKTVAFSQGVYMILFKGQVNVKENKLISYSM